MNRRRFIASTLAVAALPRLTGAQTPAATPVSAGWTVIDMQEYASEAELVLLSPDGSLILEANLYEPDEFCMHDLTSGSHTCHPVDLPPIRQNSVAWAPDSSAITFTPDRGPSMLDTDVLVFDVASGELRNLTDDGADSLLTDDPGFPIDGYASWTRDSQYLVFERTPTDGSAPSIMRISREGGEPEAIVSFTGGDRPMVNAPFHHLADDAILFSSGHATAEQGLGGIFRLTPDGDMHSLTEGTPFVEKDFVSLLGVNGAGTHMLVLAMTLDAAASTEISLVEIATGDVIPLPNQHVASPVFSPDGDEVLMTTLIPDALSLTIASLDGTVRELTTIPPLEFEPGLAAVPLTPVLTWSEPDIILAHTHENTVLLTVERSQHPA